MPGNWFKDHVASNGSIVGPEVLGPLFVGTFGTVYTDANGIMWRVYVDTDGVLKSEQVTT